MIHGPRRFKKCVYRLVFIVYTPEKGDKQPEREKELETHTHPLIIGNGLD